MVFSSLPLYLDPPNWQQHTNDQQQQQHQQHQHQHHLQGSSVGAINESQHHHQHQHQLIIPSQQVPQTLGSNVQPHQVGLGGAPIRPNSMAERARAAKIPAPETPLKCPRCDSSNTKFCYFNNYSLTQPRHFCKACRRYWTRGGALRNVPVGGGCRRNKRSSSKSSGGGGATSSSSSRSSLSSPSTAAIGGGGAMDNIIGSTIMGHAIPGLPSGGGGMTSFMASLQNMANLGLTFGGLHVPGGAHPLGVGGLHPHMDFNNNDQLMMSQHQHQHAQFPNNNNNNLLGGFEQMGGGGSTPSGSLYSSAFQGVSGSGGGGGGGSGGDDGDDQHHQMNDVNVLNKGCLSTTTMMLSQLAPVKMEGSGQGINLAKQLMMGAYNSNNNIGGGSDGGGNDNQFWGCPIPSATANTMGATTTSMWTDVSGLNSSSIN